MDVTKSALTLFFSNAEQAVRMEVEAAFAQNPAAVDTLFSAATLAACSVQGIPPNVCPNPPSLALSLTGSTPLPQQQETGNDLVPAVAGAIAGVAFVAILLAVGWWWWWRGAVSSPKPPSSNVPGLVIRQAPGSTYP